MILFVSYIEITLFTYNIYIYIYLAFYVHDAHVSCHLSRISLLGELHFWTDWRIPLVASALCSVHQGHFCGLLHF